MIMCVMKYASELYKVMMNTWRRLEDRTIFVSASYRAHCLLLLYLSSSTLNTSWLRLP